MRTQGFTLIELVILISILGILAAVAVPKFMDMTSNSRQAETNSAADALNIASNNNYSFSRTGSSLAVSVANCIDVENALPPNYSLPAGYTIISMAISAGVSATCTVTNPDGSTTATFVGVGV